MGLLQFYRDMLPHLAHTAHKLYAATSDKINFEWTDELDKAYHAAKSMIEKDIMATTFKGYENVIVYTDASKYAICAVITQNGRIIIALSKVLSPTQRKWSTIERELFTISWACKKLRVYLHGISFTFRTDHQPLVGIFKKVDTIENMRMLTMVLSTAEFCFIIEYYPGVKNVLADFGSRLIDDSEWDEPEDDDPLELNELFNFEALTDFPVFNFQEFSPDENEKIQKFAAEAHKVVGEQVQLLVRGIWYILVPQVAWRAVFWHFHFPRHMGVTKMVEMIKAARYWWFDLTDTLLDFLSTCACVTKKLDTKPRPYSKKKPIVAEYPMHIFCIDLYQYQNEQYLIGIDVYSKYSYCDYLEVRKQVL